MAIAMTGSSDSGRVHDVVGQLLATQVRIFSPAKADKKMLLTIVFNVRLKASAMFAVLTTFGIP